MRGTRVILSAGEKGSAGNYLRLPLFFSTSGPPALLLLFALGEERSNCVERIKGFRKVLGGIFLLLYFQKLSGGELSV